MILRGAVTQIKIRKNVSSDTVQTITLEVHGDITPLNGLMECPVTIEIKPE